MTATPTPLPRRNTTNDTIGIYRLARKDLPALREAASELKQAFLNVGTIEDAIEKGKKLLEAAKG